jgi:hypothetical protein
LLLRQASHKAESNRTADLYEKIKKIVEGSADHLRALKEKYCKAEIAENAEST